MSELFKFKQFEINQDCCAMKIGTDGVLLGAWANLDNAPETILDIGTGTGVVVVAAASNVQRRWSCDTQEQNKRVVAQQ